MQTISLFVSLCLIGVILAQQPLADTRIQRWNEMALSVPRTNAAAVSVNNYAIIAGGLTENGTASNVVDLLDVSTRNISQTTLPTARYDILGLTVGSYAIFAGGLDKNESSAYPVNAIEILDVTSMQWNSTQFPESFFNSMITATSTGNLAVFFNGTGFAVFNPKSADGSAWITKDFSDTFKSLTGSLASVGPIVYVAQYDDPPPLNAFNTTSSTLIQGLASLPEGLNVRGGGFGPGLVINQTVYFYSLDTFFIYNTKDNLWSIFLFPRGSQLPAVVPIQGNIFVHQIDQMHLLDTALGAFESLNYDISGNASALTVVNDKYIVIAGGFDEDRVTSALNVLEYVPPTPPVTPVQPPTPTSTTTSIVVSIGLVLTTTIAMLLF